MTIAAESQFKQLRSSPKKGGFSGLQRDSNPWEPANLLSSSTRERNEIQNEVMRTALGNTNEMNM